MRKAVYVLAIALIGAMLISGCVREKTEDEEKDRVNVSEDSEQSLSETLLTTVDSLPSGATVFIEKTDKKTNEPLNAIGSTPLKLELEKSKKYRIWMVFSMDQYRTATRDIPEIQQRLDDFQRAEKAGRLKPADRNFFEIYSDDVNRIESDEYPNQLQRIGLPFDVYVFPVLDSMRVAGVFVPAGMNPEVLLPLTDKNKSYNCSKKDLVSIMRQYGAPANQVDIAHNLLTKAGVALVSYPPIMLGDGSTGKKVLLLTTPDTGDNSEIISVVEYTGTIKPEKTPVITPVATPVTEPVVLSVEGTAIRIMKSETQEDYYLKFYVKNIGRSKVIFDQVVININAGKMIMSTERYPPKGKTQWELYPNQEINFSTITDGYTQEIQQQRKISPTGSMVFAVFFASNGNILNNDVVYLAEVDDLYALPNIFHIDERNLVFTASHSEDATGKIKVSP